MLGCLYVSEVDEVICVEWMAQTNGYFLKMMEYLTRKSIFCNVQKHQESTPLEFFC